MTGLLAALLTLLPFQVGERLTAGETIAGEITDADPVVHTETLEEAYSEAPTVGRSFAVVVAESGPYTIDLRSYFFDAYLVLRDAEGAVLAEDDDGLIGTHARLVAALRAGETYHVDACALHGARGRFELSLRAGASADGLTALERAAAEREDAERHVRALEEALGPEHLDVALSLDRLAEVLLSQGDLAGMRPLQERSLAIVEKVRGPEHPDVVECLNNLGMLLDEQGDYAAARPLYERALTIAEKVLGPEHPDVAMILNNLATLLGAEGDHAGALRMYERALAIGEEVLGPEHPDLALPLHNMAYLLLGQGDHAAARPLFERAIAILEKVPAPGHPDLPTSLNNLANLLKEQGDLDGARGLRARALALDEEAYGPEHVYVMTDLHELGKVLLAQGDDAGAHPLYERALAIGEKVLGPKDPQVAMLLINLAGLLRSRGDLGAARPLYERALAIQEEALGPEHVETAMSLVGLANLVELQGDLDGGRAYLERALAIRENVLGPEHADTVTAMNNLALVVSHQGDFPRARELLERAIEISERSQGPEHPDTALSLNNLGIVLLDQGDLVRARQLHERALAIQEKVLGPEHPDLAEGLVNLAGLLEKQGDYVTARPLFERALAIMERNGDSGTPEFAACLNNLAILLYEQRDHAAAQPLFERALAIHERFLGPDHPIVATNLGNLATTHAKLGDLAEARTLYDRSLAISERVLGSEHPDVASTLNNLAQLLLDQGDLAGARPLQERSLAIDERVQGLGHPDSATHLHNLAQLLFDLGEPQQAWQLLSRAARDRAGHIRGMLQGLSEAESYRYLSLQRSLLCVELSVGSALGGTEVTAETYRRLLEWKGAIGRMLVASREQLSRELDARQSELIGELRREQARLSRLLSEEPRSASPDERSDREARVAEVRERRNALELELKRSLDASDPAPIPSVADLAAALPARTAVVDVFVHSLYGQAQLEEGEPVRRGVWDKDHVCAWIVRAGDPEVARIDLGSSEAMRSGVREHLRNLVADGIARGTRLAVEKEPSGSSESLADLLWAPLAEHLKGVDAIFVAPDSYLGTLPMETIALADGSYLIEHVAFVYQQDVASLAQEGRASAGDMSSLLSVGAVDFGGRADWRADEAPLAAGRSNAALRGRFDDRWTDLPATGVESRAVRSLHAEAFAEGGEHLLLQAGEATEERLKHELPRHSVLHLATHGFFQPEGTASLWESALDERGRADSPISAEAEQLVGSHPGLLSGLVCAGANLPQRADGAGDDGYLTAEEVGWLDLSGVELVVMSACETGLGQSRSGEGLIGLRRAFRTAGAKTVISSLWSVGDESTAELMEEFYTNIWKRGLGRLESLRAAQLAMLRKNRMEHGGALPSTWGAFVLSGEWR